MIQPIVAREKAVSGFFPVGADSLQLRHLLKTAATTKGGRYWGRMTLSRFYRQDRHSRSRALVLIADVRTCVTKEISDLDFVGANDRLNENTGHRFFSLAPAEGGKKGKARLCDACFSPFSRWLSPVLRLPLLLFAVFIRLWLDVQPLSLGISVRTV